MPGAFGNSNGFKSKDPTTNKKVEERMEQIAEAMDRKGRLLKIIAESVMELKEINELTAGLIRENQRAQRTVTMHGCTVNIGNYQE